MIQYKIKGTTPMTYRVSAVPSKYPRGHVRLCFETQFSGSRKDPTSFRPAFTHYLRLSTAEKLAEEIMAAIQNAKENENVT